MSSFRGLTWIRQILTQNSEMWLCVYKRKGDLESVSRRSTLLKTWLAFHPLPRGKVLFTKPTPLKRKIRYVSTNGYFWCWVGTFRLVKYNVKLYPGWWQRVCKHGHHPFPSPPVYVSSSAHWEVQSMPPFLESLNRDLFQPMKCGRSDVSMLGFPFKRFGSFCFALGKPITKL